MRPTSGGAGVTVDVSVGVIVRVAVGVPVGARTVPGTGSGVVGTVVRVGGAPGNVVGGGGSGVTEGCGTGTGGRPGSTVGCGPGVVAGGGGNVFLGSGVADGTSIPGARVSVGAVPRSGTLVGLPASPPGPVVRVGDWDPGVACSRNDGLVAVGVGCAAVPAGVEDGRGATPVATAAASVGSRPAGVRRADEPGTDGTTWRGVAVGPKASRGTVGAARGAPGADRPGGVVAASAASPPDERVGSRPGVVGSDDVGADAAGPGDVAAGGALGRSAMRDAGR